MSSEFRVIPVLDIKGGKAVHAKGGSRDEYKPLSSVLSAGSDPLKISKAYADMGFAELYVADLDGIAGHKPQVKLIESVASGSGLKVMADIGLKKVPEYNGYGFALIVSSESLASLGAVENSNDFVFSIDTRDGSLISGSGLTLDELLKWLKTERFEDHILLDLSIVGTGSGPNLGLCSAVAKRLDKVIYGCGIRGGDDLSKVKAAGASGALVGSAVHSGTIKAEDLELL